jgi:hypothetical protein
MRMRVLVAALVASLLAACMTSSDSYIAPAEWAERSPTFEEYRRTYPEAAMSRGIEGRVTMICTVRMDYALDCYLETETPQGWGFAEAALQLSRFYVVRRDYPGVGIGTRIRIPVRFQLG